MTDISHWCIHNEDGKHIGDICRGTGREYLVYSHWPGHKKYQLVGKPTKSKNVAMKRMIETMMKGHYNRVMVALTSDYYESAPIYELVRK